eukprot:15448587-Alexandrium_andersonii.AAC.1
MPRRLGYKAPPNKAVSGLGPGQPAPVFRFIVTGVHTRHTRPRHATPHHTTPHQPFRAQSWLARANQ